MALTTVDAIAERFEPQELDVCNGVRRDNRLDVRKLDALVRVIQSTDSERRENP
jgi:hypothetical protein